MFWNDMDNCRTYFLLWSKCCWKPANGTHLCRSMVFTTIVLCCNRCWHLFRNQVNRLCHTELIVRKRNNDLLFSFSVPIVYLQQKWIGFIVPVFPNGKEKEEGKCNSKICQLSGKSLSSVMKTDLKLSTNFRLFCVVFHFQLILFDYFQLLMIRIYDCTPYSLTPPYLVVIALTGLVSIYLRDTSQYWMIEHNDINCPNYWWRNLFYIQNLYPLNDMCMTWSWFLAADFQCFCLTSLLLVIYTK